MFWNKNIIACAVCSNKITKIVENLNKKKKFTRISMSLQNGLNLNQQIHVSPGIYLLSRTKKNNKKNCSFSDEQRSRDAA